MEDLDLGHKSLCQWSTIPTLGSQIQITKKQLQLLLWQTYSSIYSTYSSHRYKHKKYRDCGYVLWKVTMVNGYYYIIQLYNISHNIWPWLFSSLPCPASPPWLAKFFARRWNNCPFPTVSPGDLSSKSKEIDKIHFTLPSGKPLHNWWENHHFLIGTSAINCHFQ